MLQWLESCDSTSQVLKDQTKNGFSKPLAIASSTQTAGVGRLGKVWQSQAGNLHLSLAFPATSLTEALVPFMPLVSGSIVAEWMREHFDVAICLKWPNDIFIDGLKVGGILCEAIYHGSEMRGVIVGIGLNINAAPDLTRVQSRPYLAGSIASILGRSMEARAAAMSLAEFFVSRFSLQTVQTSLGRWSEYGIRPGHVWIGQKNTVREQKQLFWTDCGIDERGHLRLKSLDNTMGQKQEITISSIANECTWAPAEQSKLVVADVGNTRTKLAVVRNDSGKISVEAFVASEEDFERFLSSNANMGLAPAIHAISVNPGAYAKLQATAHKIGWTVREVVKSPIRSLSSSYDLTAIGADRFAALESAHYLQGRKTIRWPAMIVGLGTATTVDHINYLGRHLGGYIVPGIKTSLDVLQSQGKMLPKVADPFSGGVVFLDEKWPTSSVDAMIKGCVESTLAFLKSERKKLAVHCKTNPEDVHVVLAGGLSEVVLSNWQEPLVCAEPNLAILGAALLAFNGR